MKQFLILTIVSCCIVNYSYTASKYYDGPIIPYNFGFSLEGYQHRHEEKDDKGQIMGEYGFVTGDGVYHVTAYATDENGNYKILFMKNIKIGLPGEPGSQPAPTNLNTDQREYTPPAPTTKLIPMKKAGVELTFKQLKPSDTPSCSGCIIPEKEVPVVPEIKKTNLQLLPASFVRPESESTNNFAPSKNQAQSINGARNPVENNRNIFQESARPINSRPTSILKTVLTTPSKITTSIPNLPKSDGSLDINVRLNAPSNGINRDTIRPINQIQPSGINKGAISTGIKNQQDNIAKTTIVPDRQKELNSKSIDITSFDRQNSAINKATVSSGRPVQTGGIAKPSSSSAGQVSAGAFGDGKQRLTSNGILYKFNYTVGYHGHHEQGDYIGAKDGGYYFVGRDGYKRTVDYNANEFGFRPHVKLEQANPQDVPREETEKEAGLKGYEFKWFNI